MNPLGIAILAVLVYVVACRSRHAAALGLMAGVLFLTQSQRIDIFGLNLFAIRFLELAGFLRVVLRRELISRPFGTIDRWLVILYTYSTTVFLLRSDEALANQIGIAIDAMLCYFAFRSLVRNAEELKSFLSDFVLLLAPYAGLVLTEFLTAKNPFSLIGGITGGDFWTRHGKPRCFGSFRQPDTLGMFGASFLPLFIALWWVPCHRKRAGAGILLCLLLAGASNSGGPAAASVTAIVCWMMWSFRAKMRLFRWALLTGLITLAFVMKDPIWYIFARASALTGGAGWHRSHLMDLSYRHLSEWWFAGFSLSRTIDWFPYVLPEVGTTDITNQFLAFGFTAGLGAMALFIMVLRAAYQGIGRALKMNERRGLPLEGAVFLWGAGSTLTVHIINWFGVTYFDQMYVTWFFHLALMATLSNPYAQEHDDTSEQLAEHQHHLDTVAFGPGECVSHQSTFLNMAR